LPIPLEIACRKGEKMTKNEKAKIVSALQDEFSSNDAIVVADFKGLSVKKLEALRNAAKDANISVQVVKNTLANIALNNAGKTGIELKDTNIFVWGKDSLTVCKVAAKFAEANADFFKLKTAHLDGEVTDVAKVVALSKMPSRDELIAMLLQVWNAPLTNFVIGLNALKEKKENQA